MRDVTDIKATVEAIQKASEKFDQMCAERHEMGEQEYGPVAFLENDTLQMAMEEVVDLANYARYTFVKLELLRNKMNPEGGIGTFDKDLG